MHCQLAADHPPASTTFTHVAHPVSVNLQLHPCNASLYLALVIYSCLPIPCTCLA